MNLENVMLGETGQAQKITYCKITFILYFNFFFFLRPHSWHMEVPQLGAELEQQLPAYAEATAAADLSCRSWRHQVFNPLSEARDQTCIFRDTMWGS